MDLKMEVYSPSLALLGVLETGQSILFEDKAFSAGSFAVDALITEESITLLSPENILWIEGGTAGIIEYIQQRADESGPYITAKGRLLSGILDRRILWGRYDLCGTPAEIMRNLVNDCAITPTRGDVEARKIPGLVLEDTVQAAGKKIRVQKTGGTLLDALGELGETYQTAFGVRFDPEIPRMVFWTRPGIDRSANQTAGAPVFYSTELDDVLSSEYAYNSGEYRNVTLVSGEGEGNDRVMITVEAEGPPEPQPPNPPEPVPCRIILSIDPEGGGTANGGGTFESGASVTVTAVPANGYSFSGWRENGEIVSVNASYTFMVTGDRALTAVFATVLPSYTVTASIDPAGSGTVSGTGTYPEGDRVTLTATPNDGYQFSQWQENGETVSETAEYTFTVNENRELSVLFEAVQPSRLPDEYTEVQYIQSPGSVFLNTVVMGAAMKMVMDVEPTEVPSSGIYHYFVFAYSRHSVNNGRYQHRQLAVNYAPTFIGGVMGSGSGTSTTPSWSFSKITENVTPRRMLITIDYPNTKIMVDDTTFKGLATAASYIPNAAVRVLGSAAAETSSVKAKLYSLKFYNGDELIRDFVPCINPEGITGVYDIIGGLFLSSATSTPLIAGPAV